MDGWSRRGRDGERDGRREQPREALDSWLDWRRRHYMVGWTDGRREREMQIWMKVGNLRGVLNDKCLNGGRKQTDGWTKI